MPGPGRYQPPPKQAIAAVPDIPVSTLPTACTIDVESDCRWRFGKELARCPSGADSPRTRLPYQMPPTAQSSTDGGACMPLSGILFNSSLAAHLRRLGCVVSPRASGLQEARATSSPRRESLHPSACERLSLSARQCMYIYLCVFAGWQFSRWSREGIMYVSQCCFLRGYHGLAINCKSQLLKRWDLACTSRRKATASGVS